VKAVEDPALMDFLAEHGIGIESCLTSNIQTSTVPSLAQHPLATFLRHGVLASINTDDPAVQGIEIEHEYRVAAPQAGLTPEEIRTAQENGLKLAFLSEQEKQALRAKVQG
jgi:adenosine deaminase